MLNVPPRSEIAPRIQMERRKRLSRRAPPGKQAYEQVSASLPDALTRFQGHLGDSPAALADWFDALGAMYQRVGHLLFYALMSQAVETTDQEANAMAGQATGLMGRFQAAAAFAEPELLALGQQKLRRVDRQPSRA